MPSRDKDMATTAEKNEKTNVMRLLDAAGASYAPHWYDNTVTDGETIAAMLGMDAEQVFKTLVTVANTGEHLVFDVPVCHSLDLKKAAKAAGVKNVEMITQKELLPLTGYVHGGCSPLGMKKKFRTFINDTAQVFDTVFVSAGKIGAQVELSPEALCVLCEAEFADIADG